MPGVKFGGWELIPEGFQEEDTIPESAPATTEDGELWEAPFAKLPTNGIFHEP